MPRLLGAVHNNVPTFGLNKLTTTELREVLEQKRRRVIKSNAESAVKHQSTLNQINNQTALTGVVVDHGVSTGRALLLPHGNTSPISYQSRTTSRISNVLSHRTGTRYPTTATYTRTEPLSHRTHSVQRLAASERRGLTDADAPRALSGSSQHGSGCLAAVSGTRLSARSSYSIGRRAVPCAALRTLPVTPARS